MCSNTSFNFSIIADLSLNDNLNGFYNSQVQNEGSRVEEDLAAISRFSEELNINENKITEVNQENSDFIIQNLFEEMNLHEQLDINRLKKKLDDLCLQRDELEVEYNEFNKLNPEQQIIIQEQLQARFQQLILLNNEIVKLKNDYFTLLLKGSPSNEFSSKGLKSKKKNNQYLSLARPQRKKSSKKCHRKLEQRIERLKGLDFIGQIQNLRLSD